MSALQSRDRAIVGAVEERARQLVPRFILRGGARRHAGTETLPHLETNAARRARRELKQLLLVGEDDAMVLRAVTQAERVVQLAHGVVDAPRAQERAVVDRPASPPAPRTTSSLGAAPRVSLMNT